MHTTDIKVNDGHMSAFLIRSSWHFSGLFTPWNHTFWFYSDGLASWHSFPDITHINVNDVDYFELDRDFSGHISTWNRTII